MNWIFIKSTAKGKEDYGSITARVRCNGQSCKYAIGFRIKEREWEKVRSLRYAPGNLLTSASMTYSQFVKLLLHIQVAIEDNINAPQYIPAIIRSVKADFLVTEKLVLSDLGTNGKMLLTDYIEKYRDDLQSGKRLKRKKSVKVSVGYISNITTTLNTLKCYEKTCRQKIILDKVTMSFQRSFVAFMRNKGLKPNTIYTRMGAIRIVMEAAYNDKLTRVDDFRNPEFVPSQEEVDTIWLTPDQIEKLREMDLSSTESVTAYYKKARFGKKRLSKLPGVDKKLVRYLGLARDIFIVGCLTGLRHSDYIRICNDMIVKYNGSEFFSLRQVKTGAKVLIPIDKRVSKILENYDGRLPYISTTTYSSHIKLLAELLGWTYKPNFDNPNSESTNSRFCDMITTHTCRRSFATNAYAAGVPLSSIMAVTGHSSEKNLRRYLKLQAEDKAVIAAKDFEGFIQQ